MVPGKKAKQNPKPETKNTTNYSTPKFIGVFQWWRVRFLHGYGGHSLSLSLWNIFSTTASSQGIGNRNAHLIWSDPRDLWGAISHCREEQWEGRDNGGALLTVKNWKPGRRPLLVGIWAPAIVATQPHKRNFQELIEIQGPSQGLASGGRGGHSKCTERYQSFCEPPMAHVFEGTR